MVCSQSTCVCAQQSTCSCGKQPALKCNCSLATTENTVPSDACACGKRSKDLCNCGKECEREGEVCFN